ncbi:MAG: FAD-dependent oxidoreductase [Solirubrobacteraceae bacterium]|jgi:sulfide:quinone oxidoreductase
MEAGQNTPARGRFPRPLRVLIAGGGVAALEAALALRELAGDRVATTLITPETTFSYRPMSVLEPFSEGRARRYPMDTIAQDIGADLHRDALAGVDPEQHTVTTESGDQLHYDALILAYGAVVRERFKHVRTIDDRRLDERLRGLVQDVEDGYLRRIAFLATAPVAWPLPLYELALMTSRAAYDTCADLSVTVVTCEPAPLAVFGEAASAATAELLRRNRVTVITASGCDVPEPGRVLISPGAQILDVDSIVALPLLAARQIPGVPDRSWLGLIPIDRRCRVVGLDDVYAAGDATDFAIKHGSISAQQADTAAGEIAARVGAEVPTGDLQPVLHGLLLGGDRPLSLTARLADAGRVITSEATELSGARGAAKIEARFLTPYLHQLDLIAGTAGAAG